ncbi:MAG: DUF1569 domain-containing protein [Acidobacteriota bacterium]|nr:DUF1569 domain-containing protein [Acidobacteriota bacterium]
MERKNFYDQDTYQALVSRIARLTPDTVPAWGKMNAAQMCAHTAEVSEVANGKPLVGTPWYIRLMGGLIKKMVLSDKPFPRGARTHPQYEIATAEDFEAQKQRLLDVLEAIYSTGRAHASESKHPIFGPMTADEHGWVTYKHVDHHLTQFQV